MSEPEVALVFSPERWVEDLHRHCVDHGGARIRCIVMDPGIALDEDYGVLVVSHRWPGLTVGFVEAVHARGRRVLGVVDPAEPTAARHLELVQCRPDRARRCHPRRARRGDRRPGAGRDGPSGRGPDPRATIRDAASVRARGPIVVGGPAGAGRTELAIELAHAFSRGGRSSVLVDADDVAPAVAPRLGLPIEPEPAHRDRRRRVRAGRGRATRCTASWLGRGLPRAQRAPQRRIVVPAPAGARCSTSSRCSGARTTASWSTSRSALEDVASGGRGRFAVGRALVEQADLLVGVGAGTPVGVVRLLAWAADARTLNPVAPLHLVVSRAPRRPLPPRRDRRRGRPARSRVEPHLRARRPPGRGRELGRRAGRRGAVRQGGRRSRRRSRLEHVPLRDPFGATAGADPAASAGPNRTGRGMTTVRADAYDVIRRDVLSRIERRRLQPEGELDEVRVEIERAVDDYQRRAHLGDEVPLGDPQEMIERVLRSITDLGPLTELLASPRRRGDLRRGRPRHVPRRRAAGCAGSPSRRPRTRTARSSIACSRRPSASSTRSIRSCRRACSTARRASPPRSRRSPTSSRRRCAATRCATSRSTISSRATRSVPARRAFLWAVMQLRSRIVISGEPGAGKTTLAAALLSAAPPRTACGAARRSASSRSPIMHGAYYEVRPAGARRHRRDQPAGSREVRAGDAARPDRGRRGARRRGVRADARDQRRLRVPVHGARQQRPRGAERAGERGVDGGRERDRADRAPGLLRGARSRRARRSRRRAVGAGRDPPAGHGDHRGRPALSDDRRTSRSSSARRSAGHSIGPARCRRGSARRVDRALPPGRRCGRSSKVTSGSARVTLVAALCVGLCCALAVGLPDGNRAPVRAPAAAQCRGRGRASSGCSRPASRSRRPSSSPARRSPGLATAGVVTLLTGLRSSHRSRRRRRRRPACVLRPSPRDAAARGAGGVARRAPRPARVDRRRPFADPGSRLAGHHRAGPAPRRVRPLPGARAGARNRSPRSRS